MILLGMLSFFMLETGILAHCSTQTLYSVSIMSGLQLETLAFNSERLNYIQIRWLSRPITKHADYGLVQKRRELWIYDMVHRPVERYCVHHRLITILSSKPPHIQ